MLRLAARAAVVDHPALGHQLGRGGAGVFLHQGQAQGYARGRPRGRPHAAVLHEDAVVLQLEPGQSSGYWCLMPSWPSAPI